MSDRLLEIWNRISNVKATSAKARVSGEQQVIDGLRYEPILVIEVNPVDTAKYRGTYIQPLFDWDGVGAPEERAIAYLERRLNTVP